MTKLENTKIPLKNFICKRILFVYMKSLFTFNIILISFYYSHELNLAFLKLLSQYFKIQYLDIRYKIKNIYVLRIISQYLSLQRHSFRKSKSFYTAVKQVIDTITQAIYYSIVVSCYLSKGVDTICYSTLIQIHYQLVIWEGLHQEARSDNRPYSVCCIVKNLQNSTTADVFCLCAYDLLIGG